MPEKISDSFTKSKYILFKSGERCKYLRHIIFFRVLWGPVRFIQTVVA